LILIDRFTKIRGNIDVNALQDNIFAAIEQIRGHDLLKGRLIEDIELTTTAIVVDHKLGRPHVGWFVVKKNAGVDVWETSDSTDVAIGLDASGTVTISLWVF
jgi:hypothetical protein